MNLKDATELRKITIPLYRFGMACNGDLYKRPDGSTYCGGLRVWPDCIFFNQSRTNNDCDHTQSTSIQCSTNISHGCCPVESSMVEANPRFLIYNQEVTKDVVMPVTRTDISLYGGDHENKMVIAEIEDLLRALV